MKNDSFSPIFAKTQNKTNIKEGSDFSIKQYILNLSKTNTYRIIHLGSTALATFIDFLRVSAFNKSADIPFLMITILLEVALIVNIYANYQKIGSF